MPFQPGQSGNPAGKVPGTRNKATRAVEAMLDGEAEDITRKAIELAKAGNGHAISLCLTRLCPPPKDRPVPFDLPRMETTADAVAASAAIVNAVAAGELTLSEAAELTRLVENFAKTLQIHDIEARVKKLEAERRHRTIERTWRD
jgi:Family of unknown function (DUF5681)